MTLKRFKSQDFYVTTHDPKIISPEYRLKTTFTHDGKSLIRQYYEHKYDAKITFMPEDLSVADQLAEISRQIKPIQSTATGNYRHAFIVHQSNHAITIVYLRDNGEEGLLYADSLGETHAYVSQLHTLTDLPIYSVKGKRQSSGYGCVTDAFVFARDITGKDPSLGAYRIIDLLSQLKDRAEKQGENHYHVKLPNILLKTAQITDFVSHHQDLRDLNKPIHKTMPLGDFRDTYTDKDARIVPSTSSEPITKNLASYMRLKGNKYADIIQIQYYLNQIEKEIVLSQKSRTSFVQSAKAFLEEQNTTSSAGNEKDLFEFANTFANVQVHLSEESHAKLCDDLRLASDFGCFATMYELAKEKLNLEELLRYSIDNSHKGLLEALLIHRVIDPNLCYGDGGDNALTIAIEAQSAMAVELLLKNGADPDRDIYDENTPLHMALNANRYEADIIKALLARSVKPNLPNSDGNTPLHLALNVRRHESDVIKALLDRSANPNLPNGDGDTALHLAVRHNIGVIDCLLNHPNIDPSIKNRLGETPLDLASQEKRTVYKQAAERMREIQATQKESRL